MAEHYRTKGFVLKKEDVREADQVFTVYTKDFGKLKIVGKAIRNIKSKLRSEIDIFYLSEIEFIQGKTHKTLTDAIVIEKFKNLREGPEKLEIALKIADAADNLVRGEEQDEQIWGLLTEVFKKLNEGAITEGAKLLARSLAPSVQKLLYYYFLWNLLSILGYQIDLYYCPKCQRSLAPRKLYFNLREGGIICCGQVRLPAGQGEQISPEVIKISRLFLKKDWDILSKLKIEDSFWKELEKISENYFSYYKKENNVLK